MKVYVSLSGSYYASTDVVGIYMHKTGALKRIAKLANKYNAERVKKALAVNTAPTLILKDSGNGYSWSNDLDFYEIQSFTILKIK